jgi:hypothetical protein
MSIGTDQRTPVAHTPVACHCGTCKPFHTCSPHPCRRVPTAWLGPPWYMPHNNNNNGCYNVSTTIDKRPMPVGTCGHGSCRGQCLCMSPSPAATIPNILVPTRPAITRSASARNRFHLADTGLPHPSKNVQSWQLWGERPGIPPQLLPPW